MTTHKNVRSVATGMSTPRTWLGNMGWFSLVGILTTLMLSVERSFAQPVSSWPIYRSDSGLSGRAKVEGPVIPDLFWVKSIGLEKIQSPVVSADGTIIFTSRGDKFVYALHPGNSEKWRFSHKLPNGSNETFSSPPTLGSDGTIYVGSHEGGFFAINPDGSLKWRATVGGYVGTAANIDKDGNLYVACDDAQLYVFNPAGSLLCIGSLDGIKPSNTPAIVSTAKIYVPAGNSIFVFTSSCTRIARWIIPSLGEVAWVVSNANGSVLYAGSVTNTLVLALDAKTGKQIWSYSYDSRYGPPSQPALGPESTIYFAGFDAGLLVALNANGKEKWTHDQGNARYKTMPVVDASGNIYIVNEALGLAAFAPNKTLLWNLPNVQCKYAPAFGPEGTIYVPSLQKLYAVRPQPPFAVSLQLVGGDGQTGCIDSALANPIRARVLDQYGNPFNGQPVRFRAIKGGGKPQDVIVNSLNGGIAEVVWQLGSQLGQQQLEISSLHNGQPLNGSPDTVIANAVGSQIAGASEVVFSNVEVNDSTIATYFIRNQSNCTLTITELQILGDPSFMAITPIANTPINPGESLAVSLKFAPKDSGSHSATLRVFSNDNDNPQFDVALRGEAFTLARIAVDPDNLSFGEVCSTDSMGIRALTIKSVGTATLLVSSFYNFSDPAFSTNAGGLALAPGNSAVINVKFSPKETRAYVANLAISSNASNASVVNVPLTGTGSSPQIAGDLLLLFPDTDVRETVSRVYKIQNPSASCDLRIDSLKIDGPHKSEFHVSAGGGSVIIPPGGMHEVTVEFAPADSGLRTASLVIFNNDSRRNPFEVKLQGRGLRAPGISVAPDSLDFGKVCIDSCEIQTLTIFNTGNAPLAIDSIKSTHPAFTIDSTEFSIPPGGSVKVQVAFCPKEVRTYAGTLLIYSNDPDDSPFEVELRGEGIGPKIILVPEPPAFEVCAGEIVNGVLNITNDSDCALRIDSVRFAIVSTGLLLRPNKTWQTAATALIIPPHQSLPFAYSFQAPEKNFEVRFRVRSNGMPDPATVVIPGTILSPMIASDDSVDFGNVIVGESKTLKAKVWNAGRCEVRIDSVRIAGRDAFAFSLVNLQECQLEILRAGDSSCVGVNFHPKDEGEHLALLLVYSNDKAHNPLEIVLRGNGVNPVPIIVVSDTDFGVVCDTTYRDVVVSNIGQAVLQVTDLVFDNPSFFTAHAKQFEVAVGGSKTINVGYASIAGQSAAGQLLVFSNASKIDSIAVLSGQGGVPDIAGEKEVLFDGVAIKNCAGNANAATAFYWIKNTGTCALEITALLTSAPFAVAAPTPPQTIEPGDSLRVTLVFTPQDSGSFDGALRIVSNDPDENPFEVALHGKGVSQPDIDAKPSAIAFGAVCAEDSSAVTVFNSGNETLRVNNLVFSNSVFTTSYATSFTVAPCDSEIIWVRFSPTAGKADSGSLAIHSNDPDEPIVFVGLTGEGGAPDIAGAPETGFDPVKVQICAGKNNADTLNYVLRNDGTCDLTMTALRTRLPFAVIAPSAPQTIPAGGQLVVALTFTPQTSGVFVDTLFVESNDPDENPFVVVLRGEGVAQPDIEVTPLVLNFGNVEKDSTKCLPLTVRNRGELDLVIVEMSFSNPVFATETREFSLKCNEDSVLSICFTPKEDIPYSDTLTIVSNDPDENPVLVILNGNGTPPPPPDIEVSPMTFDFVTKCTIDSTIIEVRNVGEGELEVTGLSFTNPAFSARPPLNFRVASGDTHKVTVLFDPTFAKTDTGSMLISSNDPDEPVVPVKLQGKGGAPNITGPPRVIFVPDVEVQTCSGMDNNGVFQYKLQNTGTCSLTVHAFRLNPPFSVGYPATPFTIPPQGSSLLILIFDPEEKGTFNDTLYVHSDDPFKPIFKVPVSGKGVLQPAIAVKPVELVFDTTLVGSSSTRPLTIANHGAENLAVSNFIFSHPDFSTTVTSLNLACAESIVVTVTFRPTRAGDYNETLTLVSNDPNDASLSVPLKAYAKAGVGAVEVSPQPLIFPNVSVGEDVTRCLTIKNVGTLDLSVINWEVSPNDGIFAVDSLAEFFLGVGQQNSTNICVTFIPKDTIEYRGTLTIFTDPNIGPTVVQLIGRGVKGNLFLEPSPLPALATCVAEVKRVEGYLANKGEGNLYIYGPLQLASERDNTEGAFRLISPLLTGTTLLAPGKSLPFAVEFYSNKTGTFHDALLVETNLHQTPNAFRIELKGVARDSTAKISPRPAVINLEGFLGRESVGDSVTLTNDGCRTVTIARVAIKDRPDIFIVKHDLSGTILNPGASIKTVVCFKGSDYKTLFDSLLVFMIDPISNITNVPLRLAVTGNVRDGDPCLTIPDSLNFGEVVAGRDKTLDLDVINCPDGARVTVKPRSLRLKEFSVKQEQGIQVFAGNTQAFTLKFLPNAAGGFVERLILEIATFDKPDEKTLKEVVLTGTGTEVTEVTVRPNVITPNDDKKNDEAQFAFPPDLKSPLVHIFNLHGVRVALLQPRASANYISWNGRDESGHLLLPGAYIWVFEDQGRKIKSGSIALIR